MSEQKDWDAVKEHFDEVKQRYLDLKDTPGVSVGFAIKWTFKPLEERFESGERSDDLYQAMMNVE